jgi:hypothetical protein
LLLAALKRHLGTLLLQKLWFGLLPVQ